MKKVHFKVIIKGAGDLASGVAHRLWQSGFDVILLELPQPASARAASTASVVRMLLRAKVVLLDGSLRYTRWLRWRPEGDGAGIGVSF